MNRDAVTGYATEEAMRQVDDAVERAIWRRERFCQAEQRIDRLVVTEESPDGAVRATVRSSGALVGIELSDRVRTMPPHQLASLVQTCVQRAQASAGQLVSEILDEAVPGDPLTRELSANARKAFLPQPPAAPPAPAPPAPPPRVRRSRRPAPDQDDDWGDRSFMVRADGRR